ncbi:MAG: TA system VapC family ribonuclease toxin [Armatimonadota bacterium]
MDSSVWLAFALEGHLDHDKAQDFFDVNSEPNSLLFCRATQQSFLRLITTASILRAYNESPLSNALAWQFYENIESLPNVGFAQESVELNSVWRSFSSLNTTSPKVWMDSYLAAFAIAHDHTLVSFDKDFAQYQNLKLRLL